MDPVLISPGRFTSVFLVVLFFLLVATPCGLLGLPNWMIVTLGLIFSTSSLIALRSLRRKGKTTGGKG